MTTGDDMDEARLQRLVDRLDIQDLLTTYAATIDVQDGAGLRPCFADDARARYGRETEWLEGGDEICAWIKGATEDLGWQHHLISVYGVEIEGDEAKALIYLTSHQQVAGVTDSIRMMTSRYHNVLRRIDGQWKIAVLDLEVGWYEERNANVKELAL
jgi:hypothetical protein